MKEYVPPAIETYGSVEEMTEKRHKYGEWPPA